MGAEISRKFYHRQVGNAEYRQDITVVEEEPGSFWVEQKVRLLRIRKNGLWSGVPNASTERKEWFFSSREAAFEQSARCLTKDEADSWTL